VVIAGIGLSLATAEVAQAQIASRARGASGQARGSTARGAGPAVRGGNGPVVRGNTGRGARDNAGPVARGNTGRGARGNAGPVARGNAGTARGNAGGIATRGTRGDEIVIRGQGERPTRGSATGTARGRNDDPRVIYPGRSGPNDGRIGSASGRGGNVRGGGPPVVGRPPRPATGIAYGTRYPNRGRFDNDWMFDLRGRSVRSRGPSYCRSGYGHPNFGRSWCVNSGFGLGSHDLFWISVGWGGYSFQFSRVNHVRSWHGWHDFDYIQLNILLGPALFGRISQHGYAFGWHYPLAGVWFGDPYQGYHLRVYSGPYAVAELYDWDGDGWVDDVRLIRPY
jgi:hypothetical protein